MQSVKSIGTAEAFTKDDAPVKRVVNSVNATVKAQSATVVPSVVPSASVVSKKR